MTLTGATLLRLWEREAELNRVAEACRIVTACPIPGHAGGDLECAAARLIARAAAWAHTVARANRLTPDGIVDEAARLGEMARYPNRYTVDELLAVRTAIGASARWCHSHGRDDGRPFIPLRQVASAA